MNIDLLENNPSWWWYLPFLGVVMALTVGGWLLFKHNPVGLSSQIAGVYDVRC